MLTPHPEQGLRLRLLGNLVKPITVGEAQKYLQCMPDISLELTDGVGARDVQLADRDDEPIREHQKSGLLKVGDQAEQEVLVTELSEQAGFSAAKKWRAMLSDHEESLPAAHEA